MALYHRQTQPHPHLPYRWKELLQKEVEADFFGVEVLPGRMRW